MDVGHKGFLTREEFGVAMHLMKMRKDGQHIPTALPPGLLPGVSPHEDDAYTGIADEMQPRAGSSRITVAHSPTASEDRMRLKAPAGLPALRPSRSTPYLSGLNSHPPSPSLLPSQPFPMSPLPGGPPSEYAPVQPTTIGQWDIDTQERGRYDGFFDQLDTTRQGYLTSDVAVPFFARAKLPNAVMATIW